jgi:hypothetical protein
MPVGQKKGLVNARSVSESVKSMPKNALNTTVFDFWDLDTEKRDKKALEEQNESNKNIKPTFDSMRKKGVRKQAQLPKTLLDGTMYTILLL